MLVPELVSLWTTTLVPFPIPYGHLSVHTRTHTHLNLRVITRTQAHTHKSGVLPYPLREFFCGCPSGLGPSVNLQCELICMVDDHLDISFLATLYTDGQSTELVIFVTMECFVSIKDIPTAMIRYHSVFVGWSLKCCIMGSCSGHVKKFVISPRVVFNFIFIFLCFFLLFFELQN